MSCFHPISASQLVDGRVVIGNCSTAVKYFQLPCGKCIGCFKVRSRAWAIRVMHELKMHQSSCFITLTYDDRNLPADGNLKYADFQLFMKRLRKHFTGLLIRYFMCGEYGENFNRPHYHSIIFGIDFSDKEVIRGGKSPLYRSRKLDSLWGLGFASLGNVSFASARYVANYCLKKRYGQSADDYYQRIVPDTGEIIKVVPEFGRMSLKPGIGAGWFDKFSSDVFPHDRVVINGSQIPPPRYYFKLLKRQNALYAESIKKKRFDNFVKNRVWSELMPARLNAKHFVEYELNKHFRRRLK